MSKLLRLPIVSCAILYSLVFLVGVVSSACTNPAIRREWRRLTNDQKTDWIRAVNCLATLPHDKALTPTRRPYGVPAVNVSGSLYDDFVYVHMDLNVIIHSTGLFLPWHRWYVQAYENALKEKCGYAGVSPYWDWTLDSADVEHAAIYDPHPTWGLGTSRGDSSNDWQMKDGGFSNFKLTYPAAHRLRRNLNLRGLGGGFPGFPGAPGGGSGLANETFTPARIRALVDGYAGDIKRFQGDFEAPTSSHGNVHIMFGGDLAASCPANAPGCVGGATFSANEPVFWLHHGMVDKVWYDWQHRRPENALNFEGGSTPSFGNSQYPNGSPPMLSLTSVMPGDGLFPDAIIGDVLDTTGGFLCYVYE